MGKWLIEGQSNSHTNKSLNGGLQGCIAEGFIAADHPSLGFAADHPSPAAGPTAGL